MTMRLVLAALVTAGCTERSAAGLDGSEGESEAEAEGACVPGCGLDLLVVVDNSGTMSEEQLLFSDQFGDLVRALSKTGLPDMHIGVVSSDLGAGSYYIAPGCFRPGGDQGCLRSGPQYACEGPRPEPYINVVNEGGMLSANVPDADLDGDIDGDDIAAAFACIARLGVSGCEFEQHLEAMARALTAPNIAEGGCNHGFLRQESLLAVIVLADQDDCSAKDPSLYSPSDQECDDQLGPLSGFRCFRFGTDCDQEIVCGSGGYTGCAPTEGCGDGCWLHPPSRYVDLLEGLRPCSQRLFAAIAGPWGTDDAVEVQTDESGVPIILPTCKFAQPGLRLRAVADALGPDGLYTHDIGTSVCSADYSPAIQEIVTRIRERLDPACLDR